MNDTSKKIYSIGDSKGTERIPRENPAERSPNSDTVIDKALKEITADDIFDDVESGEVSVD